MPCACNGVDVAHHNVKCLDDCCRIRHTGIIPSAINITSAVSSSKSRNAWYLYRRPTLFQSHCSKHTSNRDLNRQHPPQDSSEWRTGLRRDRLYPVHMCFPPLHEWQALQCSSVHSSIYICCSTPLRKYQRFYFVLILNLPLDLCVANVYLTEGK